MREDKNLDIHVDSVVMSSKDLTDIFNDMMYHS